MCREDAFVAVSLRELRGGMGLRQQYADHGQNNPPEKVDQGIKCADVEKPDDDKKAVGFESGQCILKA